MQLKKSFGCISKLDDVINFRYLATGDSYITNSSYRVGISTVAEIVLKVSKAIWDSLVHEYLPVPTTSH